ncbi:hypothetical protein PIGHUM_01688 [Pigmentiphaga humi]|uniref:DUF802 domain-containing protein n=1 Tax=Pigmentiphaga humi TaxID=2478468 RepID=A0A3P4B392_9BURK|nr:DUF802 domain-containing protein [Pigmentiphaga humi]VCU69625.1 hypothetical protein PIGHUM_01688 [Pigmentiphaga humi]
MSRYFPFVVFFAGLAALGWVGLGYVGANPLALAVIVLIAACYIAGGMELWRFRQATASLAQAVRDPAEPVPALGAWLERLHPSLRTPVRQRIEGGRAGLPGPSLTPYLVGLLVLLGMLGTFLGMVATLRGTSVALESATDLEAIRSSLAAPVKGLGFAFGTSVAGVAASAMLGLLSALCRRERQEAVQRLDSRIGAGLRVYSPLHQREESFKLLQRQAELMPVLVDRLQTMTETVVRQNEALADKLLAGQAGLHDTMASEYRALAAATAQGLKESLVESMRMASAAIQPAVEATMAGMSREAGALHERVEQAVQRQLDTLTRSIESSTADVAQAWRSALDAHQRSSDAAAGALETSLARFGETFEQRSAGLVDAVAERLETAVTRVSGAWDAALAGNQQSHEALSGRFDATLGRLAATFEQRADGLVAGVAGHLERVAGQADAAWREALATQRRDGETLAAELRASHGQFAATFDESAARLVERLSGRFEAAAGSVSAAWTEALAQQARTNEALAGETRQALTAVSGHFGQQAAALLESVGQAHAELRADAAEHDQRHMSAWSGALETMSGSLRDEWQLAGEQAAARQRQICETLERTAGTISARAEAHARGTLGEIERLLQAAAEAPRAAAQAIAALQEKLSDSVERDNTMLQERGHLLETLAALLDTVTQASTEQRAAVDALVAASADMLERVGGSFAERVGSETGKLETAAAQVSGGAAEVASLGEALGHAVALFGESSGKLVEHLVRIEGALDKAMARSDEQLAFYVEQAREVIDLSMMSHKQIAEALHDLEARRAAVDDAA